MARKKLVKWSIGDVVSIPLSRQQFAFARMMNEGDYEVFNLVSMTASPLIGEVLGSGVAFYQSATDAPVNEGRFKLLGNSPFANPDRAWLPPQATSYDWDSGTWFTSAPRVMVRGNSRAASAKEVKGLDIWSFCADAEALVDVIEDRLVRGNHAKYKVRD
jgi:hypothetical protein